jgi:hypothetical protein
VNADDAHDIRVLTAERDTLLARVEDLERLRLGMAGDLFVAGERIVVLEKAAQAVVDDCHDWPPSIDALRAALGGGSDEG